MQKRLAILLAVLTLAVPSFASASTLTSAQINSIISLLVAFGADVTTIANVSAVLSGTTPPPYVSCVDMYRDLVPGSSGSDVAALQNYLIGKGYLAAGYNTGYFGSLTAGSVITLQRTLGVVQPYESEYGKVGAKTRATIACNPQPVTSLIVSLQDPTGLGKETFRVGDRIIVNWSDPTAMIGTKYHIVLWPSTYPTGSGYPLAGSGYGLPDATSSSFSWVVDSRPPASSYIFRVCRLGENVCGDSGRISVNTTPSAAAAIDQGTLTQSAGPFTLTGSATNVSSRVEVWLVTSSYTGPTDFNTLFGQLGKDGIYSLGTSFTGGRWSANFTWNGPTTSFKVIVFDMTTKAALTTGTLTVTNPALSCFISLTPYGSGYGLTWTSQNAVSAQLSPVPGMGSSWVYVPVSNSNPASYLSSMYTRYTLTVSSSAGAQTTCSAGN